MRPWWLRLVAGGAAGLIVGFIAGPIVSVSGLPGDKVLLVVLLLLLDILSALFPSLFPFNVSLFGGIYRRVRNRSSSLVSPPGWKMLKAVSWVFSAQTVKRVFQQAISDMQYEHTQALADGKPWKARWVVLRGRSSVLAAVVAQMPVSLGRLIVQLWKAAS